MRLTHSRKLPGISQDQRGVSQVIVAVILIAIAVAGGVFLYGFATGLFGSYSTNLDVMVQNSDIIKTPSMTVVSVTVKNVGTVPITSCTVTVYSDTGPVVLNLGALDVGGLPKSAENTNPAGASFTVGNTYAVTISMSDGRGNTATKSTTIRARAS